MGINTPSRFHFSGWNFGGALNFGWQTVENRRSRQIFSLSDFRVYCSSHKFEVKFQWNAFPLCLWISGGSFTEEIWDWCSSKEMNFWRFFLGINSSLFLPLVADPVVLLGAFLSILKHPWILPQSHNFCCPNFGNEGYSRSNFGFNSTCKQSWNSKEEGCFWAICDSPVLDLS